MGADMTRWLQAAKQTTEGDTEPALGTSPDKNGTPENRVLSVLSVLSEGERADPAPPVATVATPPRSKSETVPPARADGLDPDAGAYLDRLHLHGPATYGAMASTLGWGATRAWQAEAKLRAAGLVQYREGRAVPTEGGDA